MEKFFVIEGIKPTPEPVEPEPVVEPVTIHRATVDFRINDSDFVDVIDQICSRASVVEDYKSVKEVCTALVQEEAEIMMVDRNGYIFTITYENILEVIGEMVSIGGYYLCDGYMIPEEAEEITDMMIESLINLSDEQAYNSLLGDILEAE